MKTVRDLLREKGADVWTIDPEASVYDAIKMMAEKGVGALVVRKVSQVVGIISERDYARKVILEGRASRDTPVRDVMVTRVLTAHPGETVEECMAVMTDKHVRHLPVMDDDDLIGIVSIGDLVKAIIAEQQFIIDQLEQYISG